MLKNVMDTVERLEWAMNRAGRRNKAEVARAIKVNPVTFRSYFTGHAEPPLEVCLTLGHVLRVSGRWLFDGSGKPDVVSQEPVTIQPEDQALPIRFLVQAGAWMETDDLNDYGAETLGFSSIAASPRFPITEQWVEKILGDSVDKIFQDGTFIHVVSLVGSGIELKNGALVVVERVDGQKRERTVKRAMKDDEGFKLVGESNNPRWNKPFPVTDAGHVTIEIVGVVIGGYTTIII
jgi:DNA-binding XRE family transcriptional regulator